MIKLGINSVANLKEMQLNNSIRLKEVFDKLKENKDEKTTFIIPTLNLN